MERLENRAEDHAAHLRELAVRHGVRFEVLPEMQVVNHGLVKVGFELQLWGFTSTPRG
jgi:hypothetical protein